ncbi:tetratricopeptide repeat protein [candidate division KSB1 bacterium]|nr:tetratricopeptide repeat protein [candidate division KSB1 bacterium]
MSQNDESEVKAFLRKVIYFISTKNLINDPNPSKRRDIREVISLLKQAPAQLKNEKTDAATNDILKTFVHLDNSLKEVTALSSFKKDNEFAFHVLLSYAKIYRLLGASEKVGNVLHEAVQLSHKLKNVRYRAIIELKLGKYNFEKFEFAASIKILSKAYQLFKSVDDMKGQLKCLFGIAKAYHRSGDYLNARKYYEDSLNIAKKISDKKRYARIKNYLGVVCRITGECERSEQHFQCALQEFEDIGDLQGQCDCINNLAIIYLQRSNYQHALSYLNKALQISKTIDEFQLMVFINLNKALFYLEVGDPRNASKYCTEALNILTRFDCSLGLAKACSILGSIFGNYNQYKIASRFFEESIRFYERFQIPLGAANTCAEYAKMLIEYENMDEAANYFQKAQQIYNDLKLSNQTKKIISFLDTPENGCSEILETNNLSKHVFSSK